MLYLKYMRSSWNKGQTKNTHSSVLKISETMKRKKIDNFAKWREVARKKGIIPSNYPKLDKNGNLAELIGLILGDGHICKHKRTESLRISLNSNNQGLVKRIAFLIEDIFCKKPHVGKKSYSDCATVTIYQKFLSKRLRIPAGSKKDIIHKIPSWILLKKECKIRFLRGLYEADGSHCIHLPTYTHKFIFKNCNDSLLEIVYNLLVQLGFNPHVSKYTVQISKKDEVKAAVELLEFRKY